MKIIGIIGILVIITIIAATAYNNMKEREEVIRRVAKVDTYLDLSEIPDGAAPASIGDREPYAALESLEKFKGASLSSVTADKCYCADQSTNIELMGDGKFNQITNNYKRIYPDSCSAPNHDLVLSFYKPGDGALNIQGLTKKCQ